MGDTLETLLITWLPFLVVIVFFVLLIGKQKRYTKSMNHVILERQAKALEAMDQTNQLLAEISRKLDKGHPNNV